MSTQHRRCAAHLSEVGQVVEVLQQGVEIAGGPLVLDPNIAGLLPAVVRIAVILLDRDVHLQQSQRSAACCDGPRCTLLFPILIVATVYAQLFCAGCICVVLL